LNYFRAHFEKVLSILTLKADFLGKSQSQVKVMNLTFFGFFKKVLFFKLLALFKLFYGSDTNENCTKITDIFKYACGPG
jgi:hypothetical protein